MYHAWERQKMCTIVWLENTRSRRRWEDNIKMYVRETAWEGVD